MESSNLRISKPRGKLYIDYAFASSAANVFIMENSPTSIADFDRNICVYLHKPSESLRYLNTVESPYLTAASHWVACTGQPLLGCQVNYKGAGKRK
jgi:hypothetical protein